MPYLDPATIHVPATGLVAPAAWGTQLRDNDEFLIEPPLCSVFNNAAVNVASGAVHTHAANSETIDLDAMHSTVTNNSRITIQTAGRYELQGTVVWLISGVGAGRRRINFLVNGVSIAVNHTLPAVSETNIATKYTAIVKRTLAAGDYVEVTSQHVQGANLDVQLDEFAVTFLARA